MEEKGKLKKATTTLIVVGLIYAVAPDPLPGPIDDVLVNAVTMSIAFILHAIEKKAASGTSKVFGAAKAKVDKCTEACVQNGKMSQESKERICAATSEMQQRLEKSTDETLKSTSSTLGEALTRKITGFK